LNEATAMRPEAKAQELLDKTYQQVRSLEREAALIDLQVRNEKGWRSRRKVNAVRESKGFVYWRCSNFLQ
jgi:hypothetical protein